MKQKIITIGAGEDLQASLTTSVDQQAVGVLRAPSWASACALHETLGIDLLVVVLPLRDLPSDELLGALSASGLPRLVAIAGEDDYRMLSQSEPGRLTVLPASLPVSELVSVCCQFFRDSPRTDQFIMTRLEAKMEGKPSWLRMVQTRDISATGMKVAARDLVKPGTWVEFSFDWPGDPEPISGDAEVVRYTSQKTENIQGMGIRFAAFEGHSGQRLREHIRQRVDGQQRGSVGGTETEGESSDRSARPVHRPRE